MSRESAPSAGPLLLLVRPLAAFGVAAMLAGRAVGPAAAGIGVGLDKTIRVLQLVGGAASQLFAMAATVIAMAQILALLRSGLPRFIRSVGVVIGGFVVLVGLTAAAVRVPAISAAVIGVGTSLFALLIAWDARRAPYARGAALALAGAGAAALVRLFAVGLAFSTQAQPGRWVVVVRVLATVSFVVDVAALGIALVWVSGRSKKLASPAVLAALVVAYLLTREYLGPDDATSAVRLLAHRSVERLITRPEPMVPLALQAFFAVFSPLAAAVCVLARDQLPALAGGLALVLLAGGAPEMPLGALCLFIGSLSIGIAARDQRALWTGIREVEATQK